MNPIQISQTVVDVMRSADDALAEVHRIDGAIDACQAAIAAARTEKEAKDAALSALEADLALQVDPAEAKAIEARIKKARPGADEERQTLERHQRVAAALGERLLAAEDNLQTERAALQTAVDQHAHDATTKLAAELNESCQRFIAVLRAAHVLQSAVHSRALGQALVQFVVPDLARYGAPLIDGDRVNVGGSMKPIAAGWQEDPALIELHASAAAPRLALAKLTSYRTRVERMKAAEPYVIKGYSHAGRNDTWSGNRAPTTPSRPSASPVVRAAAHTPQASADRPTAARAPITPADLNVGAAALRDPAFEQFR